MVEDTKRDALKLRLEGTQEQQRKFDAWWNAQFWETTLGGTEEHYLHCRLAWMAALAERAERNE